jgi:RNA polymerase sigma-70 factor (ECF subfamily)
MSVVDDHKTPVAQAEVELARELLAGDLEAFERFVAAYHDKVFRYSFAMCGQREDAEEVAQETLMKVFENLDQLREPERLKPWVFRIAKNACLMKRRKSVFAPRSEVSLDQLIPARNGDGEGAKLEIADWSGLPDHLAMDAELRERLRIGVHALPPMYRAVFLLRDVEGLSTEEAAEVLDVSTDAIKQRLHRARLLLRKELDDYLRAAQGAATRL